MEALRSQMNPHFTFNALNSIQYYFLKNNVQEGLHFLTSFSKLIRQTVENASKESILLEEELEYIRQYIAIQQLRFPEIKLLWEISDEVNIHKTFLPPMILQPFIDSEFAMKIYHGSTTPERAPSPNSCRKGQCNCSARLLKIYFFLFTLK